MSIHRLITLSIHAECSVVMYAGAPYLPRLERGRRGCIESRAHSACLSTTHAWQGGSLSHRLSDSASRGLALQPPSMDLSTLSSLLETHTSTLQRLYTTLGAPSETVSQKLEELHSALISTVNAQRDAAEREVREVQDKVSTLRRSCESKRRRLGETRRTSEVQPQEGRLSSNAATARATDESLLEALSRLEEEDRSTDEIVARRQKLFSQALERLDTFVALLGADSVAIDFQFNNNDDGKGRQPTAATRADRMEDLSLARLEKLEEEARRCEKEVVSWQVVSAWIIFLRCRPWY